MTQLSDKWAKLDNLGSLKALLISVHECNLLQLKQALAKKQLSSSDSLAHFDILDSRPNSSERQDVQLYTSMISAGWDHGRTHTIIRVTVKKRDHLAPRFATSV